jgi:outer membrane protein assembly factor BamB
MRRRSWIVGTVGGLVVGSLNRSWAADLAPGNWSSWRGSSRTATLSNQEWPDSLESANLVEIWSQSLGNSYSGPITCDNLVFTTESKAGKESAMAFRLSDGVPVWSQAWKGEHNVPFFAARNGNWIRATPVTDGQNVYIGGIRDVLVALDAKTGEERWRLDFAEKFGKVPDFGMASSPLIDDGNLYVQAGRGLHKVNALTGEFIWSSMQDSGDIMSSGAFSSPAIGEVHGVKQVLVQSRTLLAGVDPVSGSVLWKQPIEAFRGMNILTPTIWDNCLFTSSYGGRSLLLDVKDPSNPKNRWDSKIEGYMSSPVVIDHYAYMHLRNKRFACLDLNNGKEQWVTNPFGEYWSMISNGRRILALDQTGDLRLIAHDPSEFRIVSQRKVSDDETWAHIAIDSTLGAPHIIVRSLKKLTVYRWQA